MASTERTFQVTFHFDDDSGPGNFGRSQLRLSDFHGQSAERPIRDDATTASVVGMSAVGDPKSCNKGVVQREHRALGGRFDWEEVHVCVFVCV